MALFDAYVRVDGDQPFTWLERGLSGGQSRFATEALVDLLSDLSARGRIVLVAGLADESLRRLLRGHPWLNAVRDWPEGAVLERPAPGAVLLAPPSLTGDPASLARLDEAGRLGIITVPPPGGEGPRVGDAGEARHDTLPPAPHPNPSPQGGGAYIRDPAAIYAKSFAIIRAEADLAGFAGVMEDVAIRVIHACGMPEVTADLAFSPGAAEAGRLALASGKPILVDVRMVAHGVIGARLPGNEVVCGLDDPGLADLAKRLGTTRTAAAVEGWRGRLDGAVVAIGNAPTALFHLLEMIEAGAPRPAVILGFPVGFVGAAESKEALIASNLPFIVLRGRRGGSAMAAAAVNALAGSQA